MGTRTVLDATPPEMQRIRASPFAGAPRVSCEGGWDLAGDEGDEAGEVGVRLLFLVDGQSKQYFLERPGPRQNLNVLLSRRWTQEATSPVFYSSQQKFVLKGVRNISETV